MNNQPYNSRNAIQLSSCTSVDVKELEQTTITDDLLYIFT